MKLAQDVVSDYEHAFRQADFVQPAPKYDNRTVVVESLEFWPAARNSIEKTASAEAPDNPLSELVAQGYAALFEEEAAW